MSGDVQPRKRKDKKRKKDELGVEEPRGTAAVLGEGDVFMHSQHDHCTGGHWCAKIIFFSLLAILITLIGLIILENRGLSELEANAVESRYSGVLEGWLEDTHDNNHHDEHTLDLKNHDDDEVDQDENDLSNELNEVHNIEDDKYESDGKSNEVDDDHNEDDDYDEDDHNQENYEHDNDLPSEEDNEVDNKDSFEDEHSQELGNNYQDSEESIEEDSNEDVLEKHIDREYFERKREDNNENYVQRKINNNEEHNDDQSNQIDESNNYDYEKDQEEIVDEGLGYIEDDQSEGDSFKNDGHITRYIESDEDPGVIEEESDIEVEKIEKEYSDEELDESPAEQPVVTNTKQTYKQVEQLNDNVSQEDEDEDDEEFLSPEEMEELSVVQHITAPRGKPLPELDDETSSEKPPNTLAEEEEYEKRQAELRREKEQASHMWLKIVVGGALLVATHAVVRRATTPRDTLPSEEYVNREEALSLINRRMTLLPEETIPVIPTITEETSQSTLIPDITEHIAFRTNTTPVSNQEIEEDEEKTVVIEEVLPVETMKMDDEDKELYSDDDDDDIEEYLFEEKIKLSQLPVTEVKPEITSESDLEEVSDDVEIIDNEQLEEELVDEDDEEDISDVDDSELLSRLEAKYGRLPDPERPGPKHKDGGDNVEDEWPGEPSETYWRQQLDRAERDLQQGDWSAAVESASATELGSSARARYVRARALDSAAEARRDNALLSQAITAYLELLKMNERLSDSILKEIAERTLDRIKFRGNYMGAEPIYRLLIRRFPDDHSYRNNLSISFLMANRPDLAEDLLKQTLQRWPEDRVALAHLGFVLKNRHNQLEKSVELFQKALKGDIGPAIEPRFYYHLGDALLLLGRYEEAHEVHKRGTALGHFLSPAQRSLYNVERLKSRPWWSLEETPYIKLARALEMSWKDILKEGNAARALYEKEKEGLMERGEWSQLDLFVRGQEIPDRCKRAPVTCSVVRQETAAAGCRRGQVKFSMMEGGTHVRPHVGPTNCRLRMHLGLSNTKDTFIRVDQEIRQWQTGKVFMFDDSFEHEVWHNGTGTRLVLIVDVWHPDLTPAERKQLPAI